jgi:P27 family predicted phage terminase small subunit
MFRELKAEAPAMPGPPRTPTPIKAARGTLRTDRTNPREPTPEPGKPTPRRLALHIRREYDGLVRVLQPLKVLSPAYVRVIELTAQALAECWQLDAAIARHGHTYEATTEAGSTMIRPRPEVRLRADAWRRAHDGLQQLGLTPAAIGKVSALGPTAAKDPVAQFKAQRPGKSTVTRIGEPA